MSKRRIPVLSFLADAIIGKNNFGKRMNEQLPFRKTREGIGEGIKGIGDLIPKPQAKDASVVRDTEKAKILLNEFPKDLSQLIELAEKSPELIGSRLYMVKDLLDDGRLNDSAEGLSPETKFKIRVGSSVALFAASIYQVLAWWFGWWSFPFLSFIGG